MIVRQRSAITLSAAFTVLGGDSAMPTSDFRA
jgi:hypothetical protein